MYTCMYMYMYMETTLVNDHIQYNVQLMKPGIGRITSCASSDWSLNYCCIHGLYTVIMHAHWLFSLLENSLRASLVIIWVVWELA